MDIRKIDWQQALPIRHKVLWPEKASSFCKVEGDESANHYGVFVDNKLVSVASIYLSDNHNQYSRARLRKFATLQQFQGRGIGSHLIAYIIEQLKQSRVNYLWCDARKTAVAFYRRFNMTEQGNEFDKSGVLYFKMQVQLVL